ncbi:MAG TPA: four helix bundle protein [Anaeromyxobacter sp.]|nr:four helix bundle protein [Anaeromyxobacter sp.]
MNEPAPAPEPEAIPRMPFDHEKLDVYGLAIDFVARANDVVELLPRGRGYLADQLQRAALSIVLNIAEGAGKFSGDDKAVFYVRARGSATESAAVLDVCARLNLLPAALCQQHKAILERVAQMLTKLIRAHQRC